MAHFLKVDHCEDDLCLEQVTWQSKGRAPATCPGRLPWGNEAGPRSPFLPCVDVDGMCRGPLPGLWAPRVQEHLRGSLSGRCSPSRAGVPACGGPWGLPIFPREIYVLIKDAAPQEATELGARQQI